MDKKGRSMNIQPNACQSKVLSEAIAWWKSGSTQTFEISGPPGSGKTFIVDLIIDTLGIDRSRIAPMAYTGSAAINMRAKGMMNAQTIFSWLYDFEEIPVLGFDGKPVIDPVFNKIQYQMKFIPKTCLIGIDLIIVDESGMVPPEMRATIDSMGIPVIAMGDIDQLPPITGTSGYLNNRNSVHYLTEIMRQKEGNTIIAFSQLAIKGQNIPIGHYPNVDVIYEDELTDEMIANADVIICGKNATRDEFINHIRHDMHHFDSKFPMMGERLVCRKNNWHIEAGGINLTNGLLGNCISQPDMSVFDSKEQTFRINFKPDLKSAIFTDIDVDYRYLNGDKTVRDSIMHTRFSRGNKFEYGYAITCHMAQGAEFNRGIYLEEYLHRDINKKLHYVGITRFREHCIYVKRRPRKYY
jgi:exodeoxyribonuclease-5